MDQRYDSSSKVGGVLLTWAFWSWACFLVSFVPIPSAWEILYGAVKGTVGVAFIWSIITAGTGLWASLRVRRRGCYLAAIASALLVPLATYRIIIFR